MQPGREVREAMSTFEDLAGNLCVVRDSLIKLRRWLIVAVVEGGEKRDGGLKHVDGIHG